MRLRDAVLDATERFSVPLSYAPNFLRVGFGYLREKRRLSAIETLEPEVWEKQLYSRLRALLETSVKHVEFYRSFYRTQGFEVGDFKCLDDWSLVPIVKKSDFQAFSLEARSATRGIGVLCNTGGTSGEPLTFFLPSGATGLEWAHMHRVWESRGYRSSHLKLRFGGVYFQTDAPVTFHPRHNEFIVNANASMSQVVQAVIELSSRHVFRWVHGYPSLVADFARALEQAGEGAAVFRQRLYGALLGSEFPAPVYREPISRILSSNIVSWYGHSEMALLARETALGIYQSFASYGYTEAIGSDRGSEGHRLVSTSLHNRVHPFIRYDTGDLVEPISCVGGSLAFRISEGRVGDFVLDRQQRRLSLTSIIFGRHHSAFDQLLHLQVKQDIPGRLTLLAVGRSDSLDIEDLRGGFDFTGLDLEWRIELLDAPLRTASGKIKLKVQ